MSKDTQLYWWWTQIRQEHLHLNLHKGTKFHCSMSKNVEAVCHTNFLYADKSAHHMQTYCLQNFVWGHVNISDSVNGICSYLKHFSYSRFPISLCMWLTVSLSCLAIAWPRKDSMLKLFVHAGKIRNAITVISLPAVCKKQDCIHKYHTLWNLLVIKVTKIPPLHTHMCKGT